MKTSQIIGIIICLLLVIVAAGCTESKTATQRTESTEKTPYVEQPTPTPTIAQPTPTPITAQPTPVSSFKQTTSIENNQNEEVPASSNLTLHVIDIGQGDSLLLTCGSHDMLIDSGEIGKGDDVEKYVKSEGVTSFDYVVATHPHSDHIGGMSVILKDFPISNFISNGETHTTKTYTDMLQTINDKNIPFQVVHRGDKINFAPDIDVTVLNPGQTYLTTDPINQNSIVLRVVDGKVAFLLTGDAGIQAEEDMMKDGMNVQADILKVGHHGSRTASGQAFIDAVKPKVGIVSVGAGNTYGLPDEEPLSRLKAVSTLYRTDYDGTVTVTTDGSTYTVTTQRTEPGETGISSASSESITSSSTTPNITEESEPTSIASSSTESSVYVSNLNLKDEWVEISNKGSSPVSLTGWKIEDEGDKHTYIFPSCTLNSGSTVTIYTGKGTNTDTELYWGSGSPIWNNDGDTAYLYDNSGNLVSELER